jgi:hypothetical protein
VVYVKSTLTGDESAELKQFRRNHPDFPHDPTTDQFFSEEQVDSYRALGEHIGKQLCETLIRGCVALGHQEELGRVGDLWDSAFSVEQITDMLLTGYFGGQLPDEDSLRIPLVCRSASIALVEQTAAEQRAGEANPESLTRLAIGLVRRVLKTTNTDSQDRLLAALEGVLGEIEGRVDTDYAPHRWHRLRRYVQRRLASCCITTHSSVRSTRKRIHDRRNQGRPADADSISPFAEASNFIAAIQDAELSDLESKMLEFEEAAGYGPVENAALVEALVERIKRESGERDRWLGLLSVVVQRLQLGAEPARLPVTDWKRLRDFVVAIVTNPDADLHDRAQAYEVLWEMGLVENLGGR